MKRIKNYIISALFLAFININMVSAKTILLKDDNTTVNSCEGYLGDIGTEGSPAYYLHYILSVLRYLAIIFATIMIIKDFVQALIGQDKDAIKKATITAVKRLIYVVIIYFIPAVLEFVLGLLGAFSTCGI